jgi:hypothetical protein
MTYNQENLLLLPRHQSIRNCKDPELLAKYVTEVTIIKKIYLIKGYLKIHKLFGASCMR